jgi:acyl-coenzyme A synthetase/AMP-(fatty) acid ligase
VSTVPTFADFILHHALTRPEKPAIVLADRVATYDMMAQGILRVADRIRELRLAPHELVGIINDNPIRHMIVAAALYRLGHPIISAAKVSDIVPFRLPVNVFLQGAPETIVPGLRQIIVGDEWFTGARLPIAADPSSGFENDQSVCRVDLSSGTTGRPKALSLTLKALHQFFANYHSAIGLGTWDRLLSLPGLTSMWGFSLAAHVLWAGKTLVRALTPRDALQMIAVYGVDAMVASTQQLRELIREQTQAPVACPSLRVIMTAGGLISRPMMLEARAKLCTSIVNQYGSSEAGSTAYALADQLEDIEGATGYVVPGAQVEIVDENHAKLPPDTDGILRVRTDWQAQPYPPGGEDINSDFRDGWFYPGDRGRMTQDGLIVLNGRTSEIINAGGFKIAPEVIEELLLGHPTVHAAGAFGAMGASGIEEICVAIVPRAPLSEQHIIEWCAERNVPVTQVFTVEALPKTPSGKIHRSELKARLLKQ